MLIKPDSCKPCPMYGVGRGIVPDDIVPGSEVSIILQNPGLVEQEKGKPAIGPSGSYMNDHFLPQAGLSRDRVSVHNVLKCRWFNPKKGELTNDLPSKVGIWNEEKNKWDKTLGKTVEREATEQCMSAHLAIPPGTKLIVTLGELAAETIAGVDSVMDWRGFLSERTYNGVPVFVSLHPSYLLQNPKMAIPGAIDWKRIGMVLRGTWPKPVPDRKIVFQHEDLPTIPGPQVKWITYDLEYNPTTKVPFLAGIAYWNAQNEPVGGVQVWTEGRNQADLRSWLILHFRRFPTVMHNCVADMEVSQRFWDIRYECYREVIDTIEMHAVTHSEWKHDLGFCESLYGQHMKMKHLMETNMLLYNWGDCLTTGYTYSQIRQIETTDTLSYRVYATENMGVVPIRLESKLHGIRLDTTFLSRMSDQLAERADAAQKIAESYAGVSIGSPHQFKRYLREVEGFKLPKNKETENDELGKDTLAELRRLFLDYDPEDEKDGITVDMLLSNIERGGHPILEARACYQSSGILRDHFILTLLRPGVPADRLHYDPSDFVDRCYPDQKTHAQASGRWSTTGPPLPTLKKYLRKMITADKGQAICGGDYDQQELRIDAHLSNDEETIWAFLKNYDIHTLNTCDVFKYEYPPDLTDPHASPANITWREVLRWEGKDDRRRVFNKRFVYRIRYRGNPKFAGDIPGAKVLGLTAKDLQEASVNYLNRHPNVRKYWARIDAEVLRTRTSRTPVGVWHGMTIGGRKRFLSGVGVKSKPGDVPPICRENTNHPMQGYGADTLYAAVQIVYRKCRDLRVVWGYGAHDSQKWLVPVENVSSFQERILDIMNTPHKVNGRDLLLPFTMDKPTYAPEEVAA